MSTTTSDDESSSSSSSSWSSSTSSASSCSSSSSSSSSSLKIPNDQKVQGKKSRIVSIRCENLAGMTGGKRSRDFLEDNGNDNGNGVVEVNFDQGAATTTTTATVTATREDEDTNNDSSITTESGEGNLVCITGETGSGKSLLVSKIADLLTGGKASAFLLPSNTETTTSDLDGGDEKNEAKTAPPSATVEMVLSLQDGMHQTYVTNALRQMGLDPNKILLESDEDKDEDQNQEGKVGVTALRLKRVISLSPSSTNNNKTNSGQQRQRVKSNCFINDQPVTLKALKAIVSPLIAIVNAPVAAAALGRPASRLSMIDSGIPSTILAEVHRLQIAYRKQKRVRQSLEKELKNRVLPASMIRQGSGGDDTSDEGAGTGTGVENEQHFDLLRHWIEELDGFERRISDVKDSLGFSGNSSTQRTAEPELFFLLSELDALDWARDSADTAENGSNRVGGDSHTSSLYETLLDIHDYLKTLDARIIAATEARDSLASLSASDSARTALDRTRQLLWDVAAAPQQKHFDNFNQNPTSTPATATSRVDAATEQAHEMLNLVEDALLECSRILDDDEKGLVATLRASRRACSTSTEELLEYITEWNTLGRKHGVSPHQLPLCHETLKNELGGGIEAGKLLPEAKIAEKKALSELREGCRVLSEARSILCQCITASISHRLPRLGMENSKFEARLSQINNPSYMKSHLGADEVDFYLLHDDQSIRNASSTATSRRDSKSQPTGGKIENVASSGEKARILLAIECEIPGSISAIGGISTESYIKIEGDQLPIVSPVAVIYDEIDAHVGGRASISVAQMLFDQSKACQVLSITHSPSLAAIANTHICVHRGTSGENGRSFDIVANPVHGAERRKELARMASGDLIADEAEVFAEALLRDASSIKGGSQKLQPSD